MKRDNLTDHKSVTTQSSFNYENESIDLACAFRWTVRMGMDESIAYKPQFADTMPVIGGIMTGKLILWGIQAVVIGGVLWLIYIRIKRLVRKDKA